MGVDSMAKARVIKFYLSMLHSNNTLIKCLACRFMYQSVSNFNAELGFICVTAINMFCNV